MTERKELGQIKRATYGYGGYDDAQFGLSLEFGGPAWGVAFFHGHWQKRPERAQWPESERLARFAETGELVLKTLRQAKCKDVADLVGTPVEVTFDGNMLKDWRVLEEVL